MHISGWEWLLHTRIWINYFHSSYASIFFCMGLRLSFSLKASFCCWIKNCGKRQHWVFMFEIRQPIRVREELQESMSCLFSKRWILQLLIYLNIMKRKKKKSYVDTQSNSFNYFCNQLVHFLFFCTCETLSQVLSIFTSAFSGRRCLYNDNIFTFISDYWKSLEWLSRCLLL